MDSEIDRVAMASTFGESSLVVRMNMQVNVLMSYLLKEIYEKFNSDSFKPANVMAQNFPVQLESKGSPGAINNNSNTPGHRGIDINAKILNFIMRYEFMRNIITFEGVVPAAISTRIVQYNV